MEQGRCVVLLLSATPFLYTLVKREHNWGRQNMDYGKLVALQGYDIMFIALIAIKLLS